MKTMAGLAVMALAARGAAQDASITVDAAHPLHRATPLYRGACIEDVNHEIYGGLCSQMLFGEAFQEPAPQPALRGFDAHGGAWVVRDGVLYGAGGDGPRLSVAGLSMAEGAVSVEVRFEDRAGGNAGLVLREAHAGNGADAFDGYEISLDPEHNLLRIGRHQQNYRLIRDTPCDVPVGVWIRLSAEMSGTRVVVKVDGHKVTSWEAGADALPAGTVALRLWQRAAAFRNLTVDTGNPQSRPFEYAAPAQGDVSGMWRAVAAGGARGALGLTRERPWLGTQSQRITRASGEGEFGIENRGLNGWGLRFEGGKPYEGRLRVRSERATRLRVSLRDASGAVLASRELPVAAGGWQALMFALTPKAGADGGSFAVTLAEPGTVDVGYAWLEPGAWGRFKALPVRRDVAEGLRQQGVTILRYGGSMVNAGEYRWKKMIGPRDSRPPYRGTWYPYASNAWGIVDFLAFTRAAGIEAIPAFNMDETPRDMADFVEYANGAPDTPWGRRRVEDGYGAPFHVKRIELGNEEKVDEAYWRRFKPMAEAIWAKDPGIVLVVGDFSYHHEITDPEHITGSDGATSLAAHRKILELAAAHNREVWFDIHVWNEEPPQPGTLAPERSFMRQLEAMSTGARFHVAIFELNANNHRVKRALSYAHALQQAATVGDRLAVVCSANGLQPDGQNDNGWDQGLLFLNQGQVWLQPPGYVTQMMARAYQPLQLRAAAAGAGLQASAARSEDGKTLVVTVTNEADQPTAVRLALGGFAPGSDAEVEVLTGDLNAGNTATNPRAVIPARRVWHPERVPVYTAPAHSFSTIRLRGTLVK